MLKALIKKQFMESFKNYFVNNKTGKARSKKGVIGMFVLFGVIFLYLAGMFFLMSFQLTALFAAGLPWLYYTMIAVITILLGVFGSVFNTFASLYLAKDNDLLFSMPIPPKTILISRMTVVAGLSLLYGGIVWIPGLVCAWIFGSADVLSVVFGVLLLPVLTVFVSVLTCALGFVVALISTKIKNKGVLTAFLVVVLLGAYYVLCFRMSDLLESLLTNAVVFGEGVKKWGNLLYQIGNAADGKVLPMLIFTALTAILAALCVMLLSRSFMKIASATPAGAGAKKTKADGKVKERSVRSTLLRREWKRFSSNSLYLLNSGLGVVFAVAIPVVMLIKLKSLNPLLDVMYEAFPEYAPLLALASPALVLLILAMNNITEPSVSLEGKQLWILKTMPVDPFEILRAKATLQIVFNGVIALLCVPLIGFLLRADAVSIVLSTVTALGFIWLEADLGLLIGMKNPDFSWTSETYPLKQDIHVLYMMLINWAIPIVVCGLSVLFVLKCGADVRICLTASAAIAIGLARLVRYFLRTKGTRRFNEL